MSTGQLSTWRNELLAEGSAEALAARKADEAEALRLRGEVKRLEEENLILRTAAAVFAKEIGDDGHFCVGRAGNQAVATLCRIAGVSISGFYAWLRAIPTVQGRTEAEADLRGHIGHIFAVRRRVYGSSRIHADRAGEAVGIVGGASST